MRLGLSGSPSYYQSVLGNPEAPVPMMPIFVPYKDGSISPIGLSLPLLSGPMYPA